VPCSFGDWKVEEKVRQIKTSILPLSLLACVAILFSKFTKLIAGAPGTRAGRGIIVVTQNKLSRSPPSLSHPSPTSLAGYSVGRRTESMK